MRFLSLFSGIGAFDLGLERAGWECVGQCEIDPYCRAVLAKHWPSVWRWEDVATLTADLVRRECGAIDAIVGGFPCQPHSAAGKQEGEADARNLWPDFLRLIDALRPRWVIGENVPGIRSTMADRVLFDLDQAGYTCWPLVVGADDVGAPHQRKRAWFLGRRRDEDTPQLADSGSDQLELQRATERGVGKKESQRPGDEAADARGGTSTGGGHVANTCGEQSECRGAASLVDRAIGEGASQLEQQDRNPTRHCDSHGQAEVAGRSDGAEGRPTSELGGDHKARLECPPIWPAPPGPRRWPWEQDRLCQLAVGGPAHGIAGGLVRIADRATRDVVEWANWKALRSLGNAVVWQIPYLIALAINDVEAQR